MAKVKLTKNELKRQKDMLKRFSRYLPTLMLKKQQLQMVIRKVEAEERQKRDEREAKLSDIARWIHVFGEKIPIEEYIKLKDIDFDIGNIAGVDIPLYKAVTFEDIDWDLFSLPPWTDPAIRKLKELLALDAEVEMLRRQRELLAEELRITSQRVNLFEKVKIPETKENIRMISIYLGDQQTAEVVRGKIAKNKIMRETSA